MHDIPTIFQPSIRNGSEDVATYCILIFISSNLLFACFYSIYRESYALDPSYLKHIRRTCVLTTSLQLLCFIGYWLGIYFMYELCWIMWLTLSTFSIMFMGIKFGESYIILVTPNYCLQDNKIPTKYIVLLFLFWFIGSCVDIAGTVFGLLGHQWVQSICYSIWQTLCSMSIGVLIYILSQIRNKFSEIWNKKMSFTEAKKEEKRLRKKRDKANKKRDAFTDDDRDVVSTTRTQVTVSSTAGSLNDSLLSNTASIIQSEIVRMRNLICGLYLMVVVFMINAIFNGFWRFSHDILQYKTSDYEIYRNTPTTVVAAVFFPEWTAINVFIMMFSWIPRCQMRDDWDD
eukprot:47704_1